MIRAIVGGNKTRRTARSEIDHCHAIQQRRVAAGRRGYAKAVRRFLRRISDPDLHRKLKAALPVRWENKSTENHKAG